MKTHLTTDTVKILLPSDAIEPGFKYYSNRGRSKQADQTPGLLSIQPERGNRKEAVLQVSSKILPGPVLIHRGNISDVFDKINETGLISIRSNALEHACCLSVEPATDIIIPNSESLLKVINALAYHPHHIKRSHRGNNNTTFYYSKASKGKHAGKAKIYDKHAEDRQGIYEPDTVRFELTCATSQSIQHHFGVRASQGRILLRDVLESTKNPVAAKFEELLANLYAEKPKEQGAMEVMRAPVGINKEEIFRKGLTSRKAINDFNMLVAMRYDLESVHSLLKSIAKSRVGKKETMRPYAAMLNKFISFDEETTVDYEVLMSMRELLQNPTGGSPSPFSMAA